MNSPLGAQPRKQILSIVLFIIGGGVIALVGSSLWRSTGDSPELVAQGFELYKTSCAQCHGYDASGYNGPTLRHLTISNAQIGAIIKNGSPGKMATFGKRYDDQQIAALVAYLRALQ